MVEEWEVTLSPVDLIWKRFSLHLAEVVFHLLVGLEDLSGLSLPVVASPEGEGVIQVALVSRFSLRVWCSSSGVRVFRLQYISRLHFS